MGGGGEQKQRETRGTRKGAAAGEERTPPLEADDEEERNDRRDTRAPADRDQHRYDEAGQPERHDLPPVAERRQQAWPVDPMQEEQPARKDALIGEESREVRVQLPEEVEQHHPEPDAEQTERSEVGLARPERAESGQHA